MMSKPNILSFLEICARWKYQLIFGTGSKDFDRKRVYAIYPEIILEIG